MQFFTLCLFLFVNLFTTAFSEAFEEEGYVINFDQVSIRELIKFTSKVAKVNFIANDNLLNFDVTFASTTPSTKDQVLGAVLDLLKGHGLDVTNKGSYYFINEVESVEESLLPIPIEEKSREIDQTPPISFPPSIIMEKPTTEKVGKFTVCKLKYHAGSEILNAIKQISSDLVQTGAANESILTGIRSMQWMSSTNSLFFTAEESAAPQIITLIESLDTPMKQVMIEVLVVETSMHSSMDFGLELSAGSKFKSGFGAGLGSFPPSRTSSPFAKTMSAINASTTPEGTSDIPIGKGFDLGIIGDIIFHKGQSFLSIGTLLSALQTDGKFSVILNQKVITQENKCSKIFVGNNIPFAGSVVETIGSSQQTTANIEYKDIGVTLDITPMISDGDMITLQIHEEITETLDTIIERSNHLSGIQTSKTNMMTNVHVPDRHFLILSGMTRSKRSNSVSAPPCLGGIPFIGSLFSKERNSQDKSCILIFVRPQIIHSQNEHIEMTNAIEIKTSKQKVSLDKLTQEGH